MKKAILFQLILLLPFLLMGFSSSSTIIQPPIDGNWLDPMQQGASNSLSGPNVYIFLDENEILNLHLIATTTDDELANYDSLYIRWTVGNQSGITDLITKDLMDSIGCGLYQAVMPVHIDFSEGCSLGPRNILPADILLELVTPKIGGYDTYSMANNEGLFDPTAYNDYTSTFSTSKSLLCWGATPPSNLVGSNNESTFASMSENDGPQMEESELYLGVENEETIRDITVFPNPFSNTFQLQYHLDQPSEIQFRMFDLQGSLILHQKLPMQSIGLRTQSFNFEDNLLPGVYMIQLFYADRVKAIKLIMQKTHN